MDNINFTYDGLKAFPAHAAALGEIVTSFSLIEGVIGGIYGMLRHQTIEQGIEELQALSTNAKRVQAVRNEIAANSMLSADPAHDDLMKQVLSYAEKRNKIAHGLWGAHPDRAGIIYRLPVKKWINFIAASVRSGTNGTFIDDIETLKGHLEEYDLGALAALKTEGDELLLAVFNLFNALGLVAAKTEGWVETPAPRG